MFTVYLLTDSGASISCELQQNLPFLLLQNIYCHTAKPWSIASDCYTSFKEALLVNLYNNTEPRHTNIKKSWLPDTLCFNTPPVLTIRVKQSRVCHYDSTHYDFIYIYIDRSMFIQTEISWMSHACLFGSLEELWVFLAHEVIV